jgi:hypothetical protein
MGVSVRNDVAPAAEAFLTLVEPDPRRPDRYLAQAVHHMAAVQVEAAGPGRDRPDQVLVHFVTGGGRRVATLALNGPGARAVLGRLGEAAGRLAVGG